MELLDVLKKCKAEDDYSSLIQHCPYANFIDMSCLRVGDEFIFHLRPKPGNIGNPVIQSIHGGVLAGFMEHSASMFLVIEMEQPKNPKIIDFSIDYLKAGYSKDTYCQCTAARIGRRIANVQITAWQTKRTEPIALARAQFLLK